MPGTPNRFRMAAAALAAWVFFAALWTTFNMVYNPGASLGNMVVVGLIAMGNAGVLAIGVWWLTGRLPWPREVNGWFLGAHTLASLGFGVLWIVMGLAVATVRTGKNMFADPSQLLGWRMLMGIFLYGLIAGVSYTVRIQGRLLAQEREAAEARALAAEARLQGLRTQLHPHFLFNALHTVSALVNRAPDRAKLAVQQLGDLLRYSLDGGAGTRGLVPLEREWAFTGDYLELERLRLGDRLRLVTDIQAEALAAMVPVFSVQTLVENAVRHGVTPRLEPTEVRVHAALDGTELWIVVEDDGAGVPDASEPGLGLELLRQRLAAHFASSAALLAGPRPDGGFRAELRLPAATDPAVEYAGAPMEPTTFRGP